MSSEPIASYALLSDCSSAALVSASGSVDWLCFPRFDSPSVFGRLLGREAGFWSIRPVGAHTATRRYLGPTMVLETTFTTATGVVTLTDLMPRGDGRAAGGPTRAEDGRGSGWIMLRMRAWWAKVGQGSAGVVCTLLMIEAIPGDHVGIHAHNDTGHAVANSFAAVDDERFLADRPIRRIR